MTELLPHFFSLLKNDRIVNTAISKGTLTESDLDGIDYSRNGRNGFLLRGFSLTPEDNFREANIFISNFGVLIDLICTDTKYFDNTSSYFNANAVARAKPPIVVENTVYTVKGKRLPPQNLLNGTMQVDVLRSDLYGCKIMTSYHSTQVFNLFNRIKTSTESEFLSSIRSTK